MTDNEHRQAADLVRPARRARRAGLDRDHEDRPPDLGPGVRGRSTRVSTDKPTPQDLADNVESGAQAERAAAEARAAEIREEVAITDQRRAEEEEAKAEAARKKAEEAEAEKERELAEAEERRKAAVAEAERARAQATAAADAARERAATTPRQGISGATVGSPGLGGDPAGRGGRRQRRDRRRARLRRRQGQGGGARQPPRGADRRRVRGRVRASPRSSRSWAADGGPADKPAGRRGHRGHREGAAPRPRGDRARQGGDDRQGHQARQGRRLRDRRRRVRGLRADLPRPRARVGDQRPPRRRDGDLGRLS